ncbi:MAG: hypothetical protein C0434_00640 [Xanthomonadaceae bacterium]|nr:hypothetical protein [Xanthomonadaceae bacterium]
MRQHVRELPVTGRGGFNAHEAGTDERSQASGDAVCRMLAGEHGREQWQRQGRVRQQAGRGEHAGSIVIEIAGGAIEQPTQRVAVVRRVRQWRQRRRRPIAQQGFRMLVITRQQIAGPGQRQRMTGQQRQQLIARGVCQPTAAQGFEQRRGLVGRQRVTQRNRFCGGGLGSGSGQQQARGFGGNDRQQVGKFGPAVATIGFLATFDDHQHATTAAGFLGTGARQRLFHEADAGQPVREARPDRVPIGMGGVEVQIQEAVRIQRKQACLTDFVQRFGRERGLAEPRRADDSRIAAFAHTLHQPPLFGFAAEIALGAGRHFAGDAGRRRRNGRVRRYGDVDDHRW